MKKALLSGLVGVMVVGVVASAWAGPFTRREARQQARIAQGVQNGTITPAEFRCLQKEQDSVDAHRRRAWADGSLSPWEAQQLTREQNRASHHIRDLKHN